MNDSNLMSFFKHQKVSYGTDNCLVAPKGASSDKEDWTIVKSVVSDNEAKLH